MAENSKIEWTHHTFNPWIGCQKVGPGCDHCYAEAMMDTRLGRVQWGPHAARSRTSAAYWRKPLAWNAAAKAAGQRHRVFCASLADVFDNHASILPEWRDDLWALIAATPDLDWMLLTKRPGNIANMLPVPFDFERQYPNVWLGCTVVNQAEADRDIPKLLAVPAKVRFLSMEPLLGPVRLFDNSNGPDPDELLLNLVIVGGESGPGARPMHPDWARDIRDQCVSAGVAYFHKQNGEYEVASHENGHFESDMSQNNAVWVDYSNGTMHKPSCIGLVNPIGMVRVGKARAGRLLDSRTWDQMPGATHD